MDTMDSTVDTGYNGPPETVLVVPVDLSSAQRMHECHQYMPYAQRPTSCTETSARVLGLITQETFQHCAQYNAITHRATSQPQVEAALVRSINNPVRLKQMTLNDAYDRIPANTGTLICSSRPQNATGHTMILSRNASNVPVLVDPCVGVEYVGEENIRQHLISQNLVVHYVPVIQEGTTFQITPHGGNPKLIMVSIPKLDDMFAMLGMVAHKTFTKLLSPKKSIPLTLSSIDIHTTLTDMKPHRATLIYGEGHTMVLFKQSQLVLLDPVSNVKIMGHSNIMKYLSTFKLMALTNTMTKSKTKSKTKSRTSKSRTFKSRTFKHV